ncbi:Myc-type, basic helix-loop-helix (bHLH) domain-containing protein [Cynara cardunculus var. scolymus]|uniref:Myc-type, basic helix-loop-helix (BHLH) domain-containing protein n=1 Tax=Cynara cardunculus var. scolymus TaxID=59895 RepID=A0A103XQG5_CYNCS|nr:Myc-type, basic helix-loop-helix (bHLH) domain-containing protein [Cynara cardunculus var. scolymus]
MALPFYSNWPTFRQAHHHATAVPLPQPPPEHLPFHDNFALSDTCINPMLHLNRHFSGSYNGNLAFNNGIKYPTLSSSYNSLTTQQHLLNNPPLPELSQISSFTHEWEWPLVPNVCDHDQFFSLNPMVELPPLPEIYPDCGSDTLMPPSYDGGQGNDNIMEVEERSNVQVKKQNGGGGRSLSAQSMAARVRRRKISQKTLELGKLVPGGHRMSTAEMFQAALKYIKFLQAQVGVLQLLASSPGPNEELQALVTSPSVQEKLYAAEKCIVTQALVHDHQE